MSDPNLLANMLDGFFSSPSQFTLATNLFYTAVVLPIVQVCMYFVFFFSCEEWKRPDYSWPDARRQLFFAVRDLILISPFSAFAQYLIMNGWYGRIYFHISDYGWPWVFASVPLYFLCADTFLYWGHRLLHTRWFYPYHKWHHSFYPIYPFVNGVLGVLDFVLQGLQAHILPVGIIPIHATVFVLTTMFLNVWSVYVHTVSAPHLPKNTIILDNGHHWMHHRFWNCNFALYTTFWDKVCGTYSPLVDEGQPKGDSE